MKILCLYNNNCAVELFDWIENQGHEIVRKSDGLDCDWCREKGFDLTVSYTYKYILSIGLLDILNHNVVNIHNSLLPWNRGADPNLWSIVDKIPRWVTLHHMDEALDRGYIIAQEVVEDGDDETLSSSYDNLDEAAKRLFKKAFRYYSYWPSLKKVCIGEGSYHRLQDGVKIKSAIDTYNLSIAEFRNRLIRTGGITKK